MKTQFSHRHQQQLAVSTPLQCDLGDGILLHPPKSSIHTYNVNTFGFMKYIRSLEEGDHDIQGIESGSKGKFPPIETFVDF